MKRSTNRLNVFLLAGSAAVAADPSTPWQQAGARWVGEALLADPRPNRMNRLPAPEYVGDSLPAQLIPVYPNLAVSVDLSTGNGPLQLRYPRVPTRRPERPVP